VQAPWHPINYKVMQEHKHKYGLRTVATIEAAKGVLVLLLGCGLLMLIHQNLDAVADKITDFLRVDPGGRVSNLLYRLADKATDKGLWVLALGALVYSGVRFIEAYGLWNERDWAEWFALLSGCLYLPYEIYSLVRHADIVKWGVLVINILIVLYMLKLRLESLSEQRRLHGRTESSP
jgi:uncharacterized membrane protein (DUF2068 family)